MSENRKRPKKNNDSEDSGSNEVTSPGSRGGRGGKRKRIANASSSRGSRHTSGNGVLGERNEDPPELSYEVEMSEEEVQKSRPVSDDVPRQIPTSSNGHAAFRDPSSLSIRPETSGDEQNLGPNRRELPSSSSQPPASAGNFSNGHAEFRDPSSLSIRPEASDNEQNFGPNRRELPSSSSQPPASAGNFSNSRTTHNQHPRSHQESYSPMMQLPLPRGSQHQRTDRGESHIPPQYSSGYQMPGGSQNYRTGQGQPPQATQFYRPASQGPGDFQQLRAAQYNRQVNPGGYSNNGYPVSGEFHNFRAAQVQPALPADYFNSLPGGPTNYQNMMTVYSAPVNPSGYSNRFPVSAEYNQNSMPFQRGPPRPPNGLPDRTLTVIHPTGHQQGSPATGEPQQNLNRLVHQGLPSAQPNRIQNIRAVYAARPFHPPGRLPHRNQTHGAVQGPPSPRVPNPSNPSVRWDAPRNPHNSGETGVRQERPHGPRSFNRYEGPVAAARPLRPVAGPQEVTGIREVLLQILSNKNNKREANETSTTPAATSSQGHPPPPIAVSVAASSTTRSAVVTSSQGHPPPPTAVSVAASSTIRSAVATSTQGHLHPPIGVSVAASSTTPSAAATSTQGHPHPPIGVSVAASSTIRSAAATSTQGHPHPPIGVSVAASLTTRSAAATSSQGRPPPPVGVSVAAVRQDIGNQVPITQGQDNVTRWLSTANNGPSNAREALEIFLDNQMLRFESVFGISLSPARVEYLRTTPGAMPILTWLGVAVITMDNILNANPNRNSPNSPNTPNPNGLMLFVNPNGAGFWNPLYRFDILLRAAKWVTVASNTVNLMRVDNPLSLRNCEKSYCPPPEGMGQDPEGVMRVLGNRAWSEFILRILRVLCPPPRDSQAIYDHLHTLFSRALEQSTNPQSSAQQSQNLQGPPNLQPPQILQALPYHFQPPQLRIESRQSSLEPPQLPREAPQLPVEPPQLPREPPELQMEPPQLPLEPPQLPVEPPQFPMEPPELQMEPPQPPWEPPQPPQDKE